MRTLFKKLCCQQSKHTNSFLGQLGKFEYRVGIRGYEGLIVHFVRYENGMFMWGNEDYHGYGRKCPYSLQLHIL